MKHSKKTIYFVIILLSILLVCLFVYKKNTDKTNIKLNEKTVILLYSDQNQLLKEYNDYDLWVPEERDIEILNGVVLKAINDDEFRFLKEPISKSIDWYYKQYVPYINKTGDRIIEINAFCEILKSPPPLDNTKAGFKDMDWENFYISVEDGGMCFWNMRINIDKANYDFVSVNGPSP